MDINTIFDPDEISYLDLLVLNNIEINGRRFEANDIEEYLHEIKFCDLYGEVGQHSLGKFKRIEIK